MSHTKRRATPIMINTVFWDKRQVSTGLCRAVRHGSAVVLWAEQLLSKASCGVVVYEPNYSECGQEGYRLRKVTYAPGPLNRFPYSVNLNYPATELRNPGCYSEFTKMTIFL